MEDLNSFYLKRLKGLLTFQQCDPYTLTIKFGMSGNVSKRGVKAEYHLYANSSTRRNPSVKHEVSVEIDLLTITGKHSECVAPNSFIVSFEDFVHTKFYDRCPRLFEGSGMKGSKHEYLDATPETDARTEYLVKVIKKYSPRLIELKPQYLELTDGQTILIKKISEEYQVIFDSMKRALLSYGMKSAKRIMKTTVARASVDVQEAQEIEDVLVPKNIFLTLDSGCWRLCIFTGSSIVGLQHNKVHVNKDGSWKDPNKDFNVLLANPAVPHARFQFHSNTFLKARFEPYNADAVRIIEGLQKAGKVQTFDASELPPKAKKMRQGASTKQLVSTAAPGKLKLVANGVNHTSSVTFTNR